LKFANIIRKQEYQFGNNHSRLGYMKNSKHVVSLGLFGSFVGFNSIGHAEPVGLLKSLESSDLSSYVPLVLFALSAIVVYLCNRPRMTLCPRARRRTDQNRTEVRE
jgi:hypothetical protein